MGAGLTAWGCGGQNGEATVDARAAPPDAAIPAGPSAMSDLVELLSHLNPQQQAAVTTTDGPLLVIAGAGSGKTRVITHRIAWLIERQGVAPWQIFAATFTNKAAEEMRHRVGRLLPGADVARLAIATFHSLCVTILRREAQAVGLSDRFTICDDTDQMALIKDCLGSMGIGAAQIKPEQVRNYIGAAKILMLSPDQARTRLDSEFGPVCSQVYARYQERLLAHDAVDFDDLLLHVVHIFQTHLDVLRHYQERWRYVLVDEYQDTNAVQFELVRLLAEGHGNICVVGDEDQSIYSWRGAQIENLLEFPNRFPGTQIIRLEQNYRSTEAILKAASAVIANNTQRLGKELWSDRGEGEPITLIEARSELEEAAHVVEAIHWLHKVHGIDLRDIAIFYRVNALSRVFEDQLRQRGVPYRVIGGIKFYDRAEVKDLLAYLRLCVNPRDGIALSRIINKPARGIGGKSLAQIFAEAVRQQVSIWDVMLRARQKDCPLEISTKARAGVLDLLGRVEAWQADVADRKPHEMLERILRETNYEESLGKANDLDAISRRENISELLNALEDFEANSPGATLADFLERVALINAQDDMSDEPAVSLMTLHCAKGLEFRVVFLVGMEDPIFPSKRAVVDQGHFEEERRLFYVGITRARDLLFLSRADERRLYGRPAYNPPSLFLSEVPRELVRSLAEARRSWSEQRSRLATASHAPAGAGRRERVRQPALHEPAAEAPPVVDEDAPFPVGSRVSHSRLGAGEVVAIKGSGAKRKLSVRFDAGLELEVVEQFGGLRRLDDETPDLPF